MKMERTCGAKGRLQDKGYCRSEVIDQVLAGGKDSIPVLIELLTDERFTPEPVMDYWSSTSVGDVAFFILTDLFLNSKWNKSYMPVVTWDEIDKFGEKGLPAEAHWQLFLEKNGRKYVQDKWRKAWEANKELIYWDKKEMSYRLKSKRN